MPDENTAPPAARQGALEALQEAARAEAVVRRHTVNSGAIPFVWGLVVLVTLPLFDVLPPLAAGVLVGAGALLASLGTARLARRSGVRPSRRAVAEYAGLLSGWGLYSAALMLVWAIWLRFPSFALPVAALAAAPLLMGAAAMWWRGRS
jgi:hypothetical protein